MSIDTELTRLTNAKAAIKAAIEGKGVTVPSGTLLDGMAALIDAIEAGGGGCTADAGTVTLSTNNMMLIPADYIPDIFAIIGPIEGGGTDVVGLALQIKDEDGNIYQEKWRYQSTKYLIGTSSKGSTLFGVIANSSDRIMIALNSGETSYGTVWGFNKTYKYILIKK